MSKKLLNYRFFLLLAVILPILLSGCKMDIRNELWLQKNGSGKARMIVRVAYPKTGDELFDRNLAETNILDDFAKLAKETKGANLLKETARDMSTPDSVAALFTLDFKFKDLTVLNKIMSADGISAFALQKTDKGQTLTLLPSKLTMLAENNNTDNDSLTALLDVKYDFALHAPASITGSNVPDFAPTDSKTGQFELVIDKAWYEQPAEAYNFTF